MDEGIDYKTDGTISLTFGGEVWLLARPKLKTYRQFSERLQDMRRAITQVSTQITELRERLADDDADTTTIQDQIDKLNAPIWEYSIPIIRDIFGQVADRPLPESEDDWPVWLATNLTLPSDILGHWREVPKSPGEAGRN